MREETVPHEGQGAAGEDVRKVRGICSATSTPSTSTLGRSGKMIMGCLWVLEKAMQKRKNVQSLSIPHGGSARLRKIQFMVLLTTSKLAPGGVVIPMPTLPATSMRSRSVPLVLMR